MVLTINEYKKEEENLPIFTFPKSLQNVTVVAMATFLEWLRVHLEGVGNVFLLVNRAT